MGQNYTKCCAPKTDDTTLDTKSIRKYRKSAAQKAPRSAGAQLEVPFEVDWSIAQPDKWIYDEVQFNSFSFITKPVVENFDGPIEEGLAKLKESPHLYEGLKYQTNSVDWEPDQQKYGLIKRNGSGYMVKPLEQGNFTFVQAKYLHLTKHTDIEFAPDSGTNDLQYMSKPLGQPRHPGRGQGVVDLPHVKIIGGVHPNDISQGGVGDCWLLSAISALSEFQGAIHALFKNTPNLSELPSMDPSTLTVTLYDLKTWEPVDVTIDERLCVKSDESGLLGCHPSIDGELWACYLEKACAIHCGGWDALDGGHCTHAWRLLTGCKYQYTFMNSGSGFECLGTLNPNSGEWEELENSPHGGFQGLWPMPWPEVGGGGEIQAVVGENEMFEKMCAWDDMNYIMAAGTKAGSDTNTTDGIVDGHAYTVLTCINDAGGTQFDMVKVRNPWGKGEFTSGLWTDDGDGWSQYPEVKEACNPQKANDGIFWLEKEEFFKYFKTIYLCAKDMSEFIQ